MSLFFLGSPKHMLTRYVCCIYKHFECIYIYTHMYLFIDLFVYWFFVSIFTVHGNNFYGWNNCMVGKFMDSLYLADHLIESHLGKPRRLVVRTGIRKHLMLRNACQICIYIYLFTVYIIILNFICFLHMYIYVYSILAASSNLHAPSYTTVIVSDDLCVTGCLCTSS